MKQEVHKLGLAAKKIKGLACAVRNTTQGLNVAKRGLNPATTGLRVMARGLGTTGRTVAYTQIG